MPATTVAVTIARDPATVYAFVRDGRNLTTWAPAFIRGVRGSGDDWIISTPAGELPLSFAPPNEYGVLDHTVGPGPGLPAPVVNPMRVVANGTGSEVTFTVIAQPGQTDAEHATDVVAVRSDLATLARVLGQGAT